MFRGPKSGQLPFWAKITIRTLFNIAHSPSQIQQGLRIRVAEQGPTGAEIFHLDLDSDPDSNLDLKLDFDSDPDSDSYNGQLLCAIISLVRPTWAQMMRGFKLALRFNLISVPSFPLPAPSDNRAGQNYYFSHFIGAFDGHSIKKLRLVKRVTNFARFQMLI